MQLEGRRSSDSRLDRFLPHSLRSGHRHVLPRDERAASPQPTGQAPEVPRHLSDVGGHVAQVLAAAEQAAEQIRQEGREAIREAERERAEVQGYVREVRAAADAHAEQTLREAEAQAANIRANAARESDVILAEAEAEAEAERRAQELEEVARRRAHRRLKQAHEAEGRLQDLLATMRTLTHQLEEHLAGSSRAAADETLDQALVRPRSTSKTGSDGPSRRSRAKSR